MHRYVSIVAGVTLIGAVVALMTGTSAVAQTFKPVMSFIVNDTSNAVPVRVVPAQTETLVTCGFRFGLGGAGSEPVTGGGFASSVGLIQCPDGVTAIDVRRVTYAPDMGATPSQNAVSYRVAVGLTGTEIDLSPSTLLAIVTDGAPEAVLPAPVRLNTLEDGYVAFDYRLSSGIAGVNVSRGGFVLFRGTAVP